ncbi:hypothetical protein DRW48_10385 [Paracoccus suum]|uniref:Uncharacterized protein n=1 Tax=Paracoccus suum TaxID=2259340 RepID=A0A344PKY9_9RHOB|nr:hypothetical protein [Paracoccus suum]AXC50044.1 hypothetical protein DRW48_10385 [Paracoccus suum]
MSILARIRAHGGDLTFDQWRPTLVRGRLDDAAIAWVKHHRDAVMTEAWPAYDAWCERAAILEFDAGMTRAEAEAAAYAEVAA